MYRVTSFYLSTIIDTETLKSIHNLGFSRLTIALSEENPDIIVGVLLVKSLITVERRD